MICTHWLRKRQGVRGSCEAAGPRHEVFFPPEVNGVATLDAIGPAPMNVMRAVSDSRLKPMGTWDGKRPGRTRGCVALRNLTYPEAVTARTHETYDP